MKSTVCALLFILMMFLNPAPSSTMRRWQAPRLRVQVPAIIPGLPIPPRLLYQKGQLVGVVYNGKVYEVERQSVDEPAPPPPSSSSQSRSSRSPSPRSPSQRPPSPRSPSPRSPSPPSPSPQSPQTQGLPPRFLHRNFQNQPWLSPGFPDGAELLRIGRLYGTSRNGRMYDSHGEPITLFGTGDIVFQGEAPLAIYGTNRFVSVDEEPNDYSD